MEKTRWDVSASVKKTLSNIIRRVPLKKSERILQRNASVFLKNCQKFIKSMYLICAIYDIIIENRETKEQDGNEVYMTEQDYFTCMKKNKKYWASMTPSI